MPRLERVSFRPVRLGSTDYQIVDTAKYFSELEIDEDAEYKNAGEGATWTELMDELDDCSVRAKLGLIDSDEANVRMKRIFLPDVSHEHFYLMVRNWRYLANEFPGLLDAEWLDGVFEETVWRQNHPMERLWYATAYYLPKQNERGISLINELLDDVRLTWSNEGEDFLEEASYLTYEDYSNYSPSGKIDQMPYLSTLLRKAGVEIGDVDDFFLMLGEKFDLRIHHPDLASWVVRYLAKMPDQEERRKEILKKIAGQILDNTGTLMDKKLDNLKVCVVDRFLSIGECDLAMNLIKVVDDDYLWGWAVGDYIEYVMDIGGDAEAWLEWFIDEFPVKFINIGGKEDFMYGHIWVDAIRHSKADPRTKKRYLESKTTMEIMDRNTLDELFLKNYMRLAGTYSQASTFKKRVDKKVGEMIDRINNKEAYIGQVVKFLRDYALYRNDLLFIDPIFS